MRTFGLVVGLSALSTGCSKKAEPTVAPDGVSADAATPSVTAPRAGVAPGAPEAGVSAHGPLSVTQVTAVVRPHSGDFRKCYLPALADNPTLQGRVVAHLVIGKTGAVTAASDGGSDIPDPMVATCVIDAFHALIFPASSGVTDVSYPIVFSPDG
jgi:hypothetical protein